MGATTDSRRAADRPLGRLLRTVGYWLLWFVVLMEVVLQVGAFFIWLGGDKVTGEAGAGQVVLCVGDSMTHGLGATDPSVRSYPGQLEPLLRSRDPRPWSVVKAAWPGQNSRDVLLKLPGQLTRYEPDFVCILIGANDFWTRPAFTEPPPAEESGDSFRLEWRTGRLLAIIADSLGGELTQALHDDGGDPPFLGRWHHGETELEFERGGRLLAAGAELRWELRERRLLVILPAQQREIEVGYRRDGDRLLLDSAWSAIPSELVAGPAPVPSPLRAGQAALRERRWEDAIEAFEACVDDEDDAVAAHEGLVSAWTGLGDGDAADEHVTWLRDRAAERPDRAVAESLAHALSARGDVDGALAVASRVVERHPESRRGWEVLMTHGLQDRGRGVVLDAIDRALARLALDRGIRVDMLRMRALLLRSTDPVAALQSHFAAVLAGGDEAATVQHLFVDREVFTGEVLEQCLSGMSLEPDTEQRLRRVYADAMRGEAGVVAILRAHLTSMIDLCRRAGAEPVLLTYPFEQAQHGRLVERLAADEEVAWVAVRPEFVRLLRTKRRQDLFVPDGHCTDEGYGVTARLVADELLSDSRR